MRNKIRFIPILTILVIMSLCTKPKIEDKKEIEIHEPVSILIDEIFEIRNNQYAIITDTSRIVNDSFPKYSVYFDWMEDKRCSPCVSCLGGLVSAHIHIINNATKECISDTLVYPTCTDNYLQSDYSSQAYSQIHIDTLALWMKRVLPMKPMEGKNYIEMNEYRVSLIIKKRK